MGIHDADHVACNQAIGCEGSCRVCLAGDSRDGLRGLRAEMDDSAGLAGRAGTSQEGIGRQAIFCQGLRASPKGTNYVGAKTAAGMAWHGDLQPSVSPSRSTHCTALEQST